MLILVVIVVADRLAMKRFRSRWNRFKFTESKRSTILLDHVERSSMLELELVLTCRSPDYVSNIIDHYTSDMRTAADDLVDNLVNKE